MTVSTTKAIVISTLEKLMRDEQQNGQVYKARAYGKVLSQIRSKAGNINGWEDLKNVTGIGEKIRAKIEDIFQTGVVSHDAESFDFETELMTIYGIGQVKARDLVETQNIHTIDELIQNQHLLNEKQKIGLKHLTDLQQRIPRHEMLMHEKKIKNIAATITPDFEVTIVGSFRRGAAESGDIDVLLRLPPSFTPKDNATLFKRICDDFVTKMYVCDVLAQGARKFMGVCRLSPGIPARRIDALITPFDGYPFALLYFTGSYQLNIYMRRKALEKGFSLSEHGMKKTRENVPDIPHPILNESDIFNFLGMRYLPPSQREVVKNL